MIVTVDGQDMLPIAESHAQCTHLGTLHHVEVTIQLTFVLQVTREIIGDWIPQLDASTLVDGDHHLQPSTETEVAYRDGMEIEHLNYFVLLLDVFVDDRDVTRVGVGDVDVRQP